AMRAKEKERVAVLRLVMSEFKRIEVDERIDVDDTRALALLDKMVKQRRDSEQQYLAAGRSELAAQEAYEISEIQAWLPAALSAAELETIVTQAIADAGVTEMRDMGKAMALIKPQVQGRADMGESFIDDMLDRLDIVDVVDSRVKLRKTGKNYSACCPFHDEKTPSFTVSPEKQFYYCFGCGASGNALGFVMDYERLSFPEAVESLARLTGLEVPREVQTEAQAKREQEKRSIYTLLEKADEFYQQQLRHHP
ncbi:hypothetical protein BVRB_024720, partial [Beta vulgaris subsp. vulgaris]